MAGGNKSHSLKTKKRNLQKQSQETKKAEEKRKRFRDPASLDRRN